MVDGGDAIADNSDERAFSRGKPGKLFKYI